MKTTINGKRYDSNKCEALCSYDHRSHSNNYAGTSTLMLASDGTYLIWTDSNGQDRWVTDDFHGFDEGSADSVAEFVDRCDIQDDEEQRLVELGLITIVE